MQVASYNNSGNSRGGAIHPYQSGCSRAREIASPSGQANNFARPYRSDLKAEATVELRPDRWPLYR
jgi:hypothetical protein